MKLPIIETIRKNLRQKIDIVFEANIFASLNEMLSANTAKLRVVPQQVSEFSPLLNEIGFRKPGHFLVKSGDTNHFTQHPPGIVEAQSLVEVACHDVSFSTWKCNPHKLPFSFWSKFAIVLSQARW